MIVKVQTVTQTLLHVVDDKTKTVTKQIPIEIAHELSAEGFVKAFKEINGKIVELEKDECPQV